MHRLFAGDHCRSRPVSMESGLEGRNNTGGRIGGQDGEFVSMESGLEGRNNLWPSFSQTCPQTVSMESGLEGRNNLGPRAEQLQEALLVSMESGLEGRNNLPEALPRRDDTVPPSQWSPA